MSKILFEINGIMLVNGKKVASQGDDILIDGSFITSGCADAAIAKSIGLENIITSLGSCEVLGSFTSQEFIDYIINGSAFEDHELRNIASSINESLELDLSIEVNN